MCQDISKSLQVEFPLRGVYIRNTGQARRKQSGKGKGK